MKSDRENLKDAFSPCTIQDIDVSLLSEEVTPKTKENPERLSDKESNDDVSKDTITESNYKIPDAFIFCPNMGTMQFDKVLEQGIFISENEMRQMEETKASLLYKFCTLTFLMKLLPRARFRLFKTI